MYYPPKFDLRHFMSHLAPGGYYFIQLLLIATFVVWYLFPCSIKAIHLDQYAHGGAAGAVLLAFVALVFSVFCYFVGVVLRLPTVDEIDDISVEYNIRNYWFTKLKRGSVSFLKYCATVVTILKPLPMYCIYSAKGLTCSQVKKVLDSLSDSRFRKDEQVIFASLRTKLTDKDASTKFSDWLRELAATVIKESNQGTTDYYSSVTGYRWMKDEEWSFLKLLWHVDQFPYPLYMLYTTNTRKGKLRWDEFYRLLFPVLLETMRGNISAEKPWTVPFNSCKLFVRSRSLELGNEINDREALVRMMAGFYRGLSLGLLASTLVFLLSIISIVDALVFHVISNVLQQGHLISDYVYVMIIAILMMLFNRHESMKIVRNFHTLRMSESETVFESYLIAQSMKPHDVQHPM